MTVTVRDTLAEVLRTCQENIDNLPPANPSKKQLQEAFNENQALANELISGTVEEARLKASKGYLLDCYITNQLIDALIAQYENKDTALSPAVEGERDMIVSQLKTQKLKFTQAINQAYGTSMKAKDVNIFGVAKHQYYQDAYRFDAPNQIQQIVEEMCKLFREKGENPPLTFIVNSPTNESSRNQSTKELREDIANNILTAAAKLGYTPDEIKIVIDKTPYPTTKSALGESQYKSWEETANKEKSRISTQEKSTIRPSRI